MLRFSKRELDTAQKQLKKYGKQLDFANKAFGKDDPHSKPYHENAGWAVELGLIHQVGMQNLLVVLMTWRWTLLDAIKEPERLEERRKYSVEVCQEACYKRHEWSEDAIAFMYKPCPYMSLDFRPWLEDAKINPVVLGVKRPDLTTKDEVGHSAAPTEKQRKTRKMAKPRKRKAGGQIVQGTTATEELKGLMDKMCSRLRFLEEAQIGFSRDISR
jgi:hypothetical protein